MRFVRAYASLVLHFFRYGDAGGGLRGLILLADGHDAEHDAAAREVFVRDALHVRRRGRLVFVVLVREAMAWIAEVALAEGETERLAGVRLEARNETQL